MRVWGLLFISLWLTSCASQPEQARLYPAQLESCVNQLTDFKHQVQSQGVQDAQLHWLPQYPHLAFDRFSLALLADIQSHQDRAQWLNYVNQQAAIQRNVEYQNLPDKTDIDFPAQEKCAIQLTAHTLNDKQFWQQLKNRPPAIASNYQDWQRIIGLYPISQLFAAPAIESEQTRIVSDFIAPLHNDLISYKVAKKPLLTPQQVRVWFDHALARSNLSWPQLTSSQLADLQQFYTPEFLVESASKDDIPGKVAYHPGRQPYINTNQPTLYFDHSYTRFHGQILLQLHYSLWFANRTAKSTFDPYAGKFDGILIRLTLNQQGQPYILDSIHHCGCYHMIFALNPQLKFAQRTDNTESPITLYVNPRKTADTLRITLSEGEHMIKGVRWTDSVPSSLSLTQLSYDQLRSLPLPDGTHKSLFDEEGMLLESQRFERFYLWPFGVKSPGAMRQLGHHATTFIGKRHFDDPSVLEAFFMAPYQ